MLSMLLLSIFWIFIVSSQNNEQLCATERCTKLRHRKGPGIGDHPNSYHTYITTAHHHTMLPHANMHLDDPLSLTPCYALTLCFFPWHRAANELQNKYLVKGAETKNKLITIFFKLSKKFSN